MTLNAPPRIGRLNGGKSLRVARPAVACLGALLLMSTMAYSQVPESRVVAAQGLPDPLDPNNLGEPVWETWIAAGAGQVVSVFHQEVDATTTSAFRIGYAIYDRDEGSWIEHGIIPPASSGAFGEGDPSIAALNTGSSAFVASCYMRKPGYDTAIGFARYEDGDWTPWEALTQFQFGSGYGSSPGYDKPWIFTGDLYESEREITITFWRARDPNDPNDPNDSFDDTPRHSYLRSTNSGVDWVLGDITYGIGGDFVESSGPGYQPAAAADGRMYIAFRPPDPPDQPGLTEIRFLKGVDIDDPNDAHAGEIEFARLWTLQRCESRDPGDWPPIEMVVTRNRTAKDIQKYIPGGRDPQSNCDSVMSIQTIPFLAADPSDPNQLYLVYHDTETDEPNDTDVNVYLHSLRHYPFGWCGWGTRIRVNENNSEYESDQFLPQMAVDAGGRIHVIWYDDRRYNIDSDQRDGCDPNDGTPHPKFDVYYGYSEDGGEHWFNVELAKDPNDPNEPEETCLDYTLLEGCEFPSRPGEYNGISCYGDEVWTSFTGTWHLEVQRNPESNPSVIWSCRIPFE